MTQKTNSRYLAVAYWPMTQEAIFKPRAPKIMYPNRLKAQSDIQNKHWYHWNNSTDKDKQQYPAGLTHFSTLCLIHRLSWLLNHCYCRGKIQDAEEHMALVLIKTSQLRLNRSVQSSQSVSWHVSSETSPIINTNWWAGAHKVVTRCRATRPSEELAQSLMNR